ncbi:ALK and LTK ligand 2b [Nothobranchius furzeri]|uniref:ALK and LTK ligand 2b n=1 Tax=Nothobranchius furzeri TaxID=105023 RepID=UPI003904D550
MLLPRLLLPLLPLLLMPPGPCYAATEQRSSRTRSEGRGAGRRRVESLGFTGYTAPLRTSRSKPEGQFGDPKYKEMFFAHLTGPLSIKPQCQKQFNRLYHNTRDCTVPAYFRRCVRMLTQLANSPCCAKKKNTQELTLDRKCWLRDRK